MTSSCVCGPRLATSMLALPAERLTWPGRTKYPPTDKPTARLASTPTRAPPRRLRVLAPHPSPLVSATAVVTTITDRFMKDPFAVAFDWYDRCPRGRHSTCN